MELFVGSMELANMSSNLTDAIAFMEWHRATMQIKDEMGITPNELDYPLLEAVSKGLPPSAVFGVGVDRLLMVALGLSSIVMVKPFAYGTNVSNGGKKHE